MELTDEGIYKCCSILYCKKEMKQNINVQGCDDDRERKTSGACGMAVRN